MSEDTTPAIIQTEVTLTEREITRGLRRFLQSLMGDYNAIYSTLQDHTSAANHPLDTMLEADLHIARGKSELATSLFNQLDGIVAYITADTVPF